MIKSFALLGIVALQSYGAFGIGAHWAPALGYKIKSDTGTVFNGPTGTGSYVKMNEGGASGLQGFGVKMWVDAIPFIDIEATGNFQYGYYNVDIITKQGFTAPEETSSVSYDPPASFLEGRPVYARAYGDFSILYPFLKFPPGITLVKVYAGGGLTYGVSTIVLNHKFASDALAEDGGYSAVTDSSTTTSRNGAKIISDAFTNKGFQTGFGGYAQLGAHLKPPIIPIALYVDFKYHFFGFSPVLADESGMTMELGGAIAF